MSGQDMFGRVLASLHEAMLDDAHWPATAALIDDACGINGNNIVVSEGLAPEDVKVHFAKFYRHGQPCEEWVREYFQLYHPQDERLPRLRRLPHGRLVHVTDLYTERELKASATYNEALRRYGSQNSLDVRMDGPDGLRIVWTTTDPSGPDGWSSAQLEMIRCLLPHICQFVRIREAMANAETLGASLTMLLDNTKVGVIRLDRRGMIATANDRALRVLRKGDGLWDQDGFLHAQDPDDDIELERLLARALPTLNVEAVSGSMLIRRPSTVRRLVVHVNPLTARQMDFGARDVGALVLLVDPDSQPRIDPGFVAKTLGITLTESRIAAWLAAGRTIPDIAVSTNRQKSSIRWHIKQIYAKQGISRQADLVRLVLSTADVEGF